MADSGANLKSISLAELKIIDGKIQDHEAEVAALEASLDALRSKRRVLDEERNKALPISKLPPEVLAKIFLLTPATSSHPALEDMPGPFVIGRVCRDWRRIAWANPRLWTNITLPLSPKRHAVQKELLQEWIDRSGQCELHVKITKAATSIEKDEEMRKWEPPVEVFRILLGTCHRWASLHLFAFENFFKALGQMPNARFTSLGSLTIVRYTMQDYFSRPPQADWVFKLDAPINTLDVDSGVTQRNLDFRWAHLRVLDGAFAFEDWLEVLKQCSVLSSCTMSIDEDHYAETPEPSSEPIVLPQLNFLQISGSEREAASLMRSLEIPALRVLRISVVSARGPPSWAAALLEMTLRSRFQLRDLDLEEENWGDEDCVAEHEISSLLAQLSSLKRLGLRFMKPFILSDLLISRLSLPSDSEKDEGPNRIGFLSNLKTFTYHGHVCFALETLTDVLKSRAAAAAATSRRSATKSQPFRMNITYTNVQWYRNKDPNVVHEFYDELIALSNSSVQANLSFEGHA